MLWSYEALPANLNTIMHAKTYAKLLPDLYR